MLSARDGCFGTRPAESAYFLHGLPIAWGSRARRPASTAYWVDTCNPVGGRVFATDRIVHNGWKIEKRAWHGRENRVTDHDTKKNFGNCRNLFTRGLHS